jgi:hypothetical protein
MNCRLYVATLEPAKIVRHRFQHRTRQLRQHHQHELQLPVRRHEAPGQKRHDCRRRVREARAQGHNFAEARPRALGLSCRLAREVHRQPGIRRHAQEPPGCHRQRHHAERIRDERPRGDRRDHQRDRLATRVRHALEDDAERDGGAAVRYVLRKRFHVRKAV